MQLRAVQSLRDFFTIIFIKNPNRDLFYASSYVGSFTFAVTPCLCLFHICSCDTLQQFILPILLRKVQIELSRWLECKYKILPDTLKSYQTIAPIEKCLVNNPTLFSPCTHMQYSLQKVGLISLPYLINSSLKCHACLI